MPSKSLRETISRPTGPGSPGGATAAEAGSPISPELEAAIRALHKHAGEADSVIFRQYWDLGRRIEENADRAIRTAKAAGLAPPRHARLAPGAKDAKIRYKLKTARYAFAAFPRERRMSEVKELRRADGKPLGVPGGRAALFARPAGRA